MLGLLPGSYPRPSQRVWLADGCSCGGCWAYAFTLAHAPHLCSYFEVLSSLIRKCTCVCAPVWYVVYELMQGVTAPATLHSTHTVGTAHCAHIVQGACFAPAYDTFTPTGGCASAPHGY